MNTKMKKQLLPGIHSNRASNLHACPTAEINQNLKKKHKYGLLNRMVKAEENLTKTPQNEDLQQQV